MNATRDAFLRTRERFATRHASRKRACSRDRSRERASARACAARRRRTADDRLFKSINHRTNGSYRRADAGTHEGGREEMRAVVRQRARGFCFLRSYRHRIVVVVVVVVVVLKRRRREDARETSASGDPRRVGRPRSRSRDRAFVARVRRARITRLDERVRARRERIVLLEIVLFSRRRRASFVAASAANPRSTHAIKKFFPKR